MRVQDAVVRQLQQPTTATYAITSIGPDGAARNGAKWIFWAITSKDPALPFVRVRKSGHGPMLDGLKARRLPASANIEIVSYAKSQDAAADLAEAVSLDLIGDPALGIQPFKGLMPNTSPITSGAIYVHQIDPGNEEDLVSEEALVKNIFAELREYIVRYDQR